MDHHLLTSARLRAPGRPAIAVLVLALFAVAGPVLALGAGGASAAPRQSHRGERHTVVGRYGPKPARSTATAPLGHAGRWITNADGQIVVLHGINLVAKTQASGFAPAGLGFGAADAAFLAKAGFNAVRLGVIYQALEPAPGVFDDDYLDSIVATQQLLARYGIYSLVDMHDDDWGPSFGGEGFPKWATPGGTQNTSWDDFWADESGPGGIPLQSYYAEAVEHVAQRFADESYVLGYDLINEPNPGEQTATCTNPLVCTLDPGLTTFYRQVITAVRKVDPHHLAWVEPNLEYDSGGAESIPSLGDPEVGFSFHVYCLLNAVSGGTEDNSAFCPADEKLVFGAAQQESERTGDALMLTEFGSTPDTGLIERVANEADAAMMSWTEWTLTSNGSTDFAATPSLIKNEHLPPTGSNVNKAQLDALVRAYPQLISGTPRSWSYDPSTGAFSLTYSTERAAGEGVFASGAKTEIALPALDYPRGYTATVSGGSVVSRADAHELVVSAAAGAGSVTVRVAPAGR